MKKIIRKIMISLFNIPKRVKLIKAFAGLLNMDLMNAAYRSIGIDNVEDLDISGEHFFIKTILKDILKKNKDLLFFDVGANIGDYSIILQQNFQNSRIYSFEPHPETFKKLESNTSNFNNIECYNFGMSSIPEFLKLYEDKNLHSGLCSVYRDVFNKYESIDVSTFDVKLDTIDLFSKNKLIQKINFLKIDTEGHEFKCMEGAKGMIENGNIDVIQFEFNHMNSISRIFVKDFEELLENFSLFRLNTNSLIPLKKNGSNEYFAFQNIIAINKNLNFDFNKFIVE